MEEKDTLRQSSSTMSLVMKDDGPSAKKVTKSFTPMLPVTGRLYAFPQWIKICAGVSTIALVCNLALTAVVVMEARPAVEDLVSSVQGAFSGIDTDELNVAVRRAVKVLDLLCEDLIECD